MKFRISSSTLDVVFKVGVLVLGTALLVTYILRSANERYVAVTVDGAVTILDTRTGRTYLYMAERCVGLPAPWEMKGYKYVKDAER